MKVVSASEACERLLSEDPLGDYFTWWDQVKQSDVEAFTSALDNATCEEDIQQFLQNHPQILIQHFGGGHGRWVIPKKKLGSEHVTDFIIGQKSSIGFEWQVVELESPLRPLFNKSGDPSQYLNHAIRQIQDWRIWLNSNQNYASRPKSESGLGLTEISSSVPGLIIIGRRDKTLTNNNARRKQMAHNLNIEIRTYDHLLDTLQGRINANKLHEKEIIL
ncbi:Shedu immune nuclease family protein [Pseudomonas sp. RL_15y_Pfl2_60]|uniref:Shedu immune nuclease family protein n=1 Tax=Pseudomonas sp. RL_15y_Pfl2_60 TaxID=3088709 RepID=UPI0030D88510